ncbi:MAG TPA: glycosyltransferase family 1 protein, partial [Anaerolineae bacterium]|nr:glycosyltransferase family 1 protein [Anaerolineae bacterium]
MLSVHTCPLAALGGKETGGMNVYVRELSRELARRGIAVDIFTRSQNPAIPRVNDVELGQGARVIHIKAGPEEPYHKNLVWNHLSEFVDGVRRFAREEGFSYDLFHSHYWLSGWVARALQRDWSIPVIHMFHTLGRMKNRVARSEAEREIAQRIRVETEIMAFADRIVAATPRDKAQMVELYGADPDKITVIPCGVDLELFQQIPCQEAKAELGVPGDHHLVLFVGRIEPLKGIDTLLRAMALMLEEESGWRGRVSLCIIGGDVSEDALLMDEEMRRLHRLRDELGIADVVIFAGAQAQETLPCTYSAADVVVVPSHYESFGMVALEAMACGAPVIASDVGGLSFLVEDGRTGFLVPEGDPAALADRLHRVLADRSLRDFMGIAGIKMAQGYGWPLIADQIVALYQQSQIREGYITIGYLRLNSGEV